MIKYTKYDGNMLILWVNGHLGSKKAPKSIAIKHSNFDAIAEENLIFYCVESNYVTRRTARTIEKRLKTMKITGKTTKIT